MERDFHILKVAVNEQLKKMEENFENLFVVNVDNYKLWATYLDSFPAEENPVFRERRVYDCNCCKHFFKNIGNVVAIDKNNQLVSVWDIETGDAVFSISALNFTGLSKTMLSHPLSSFFSVRLFSGRSFNKDLLKSFLSISESSYPNSHSIL